MTAAQIEAGARADFAGRMSVYTSAPTWEELAPKEQEAQRAGFAVSLAFIREQAKDLESDLDSDADYFLRDTLVAFLSPPPQRENEA